MNDKEKIAHLLCRISALLGTKDEHLAVINLSVKLGIIYGQQIQVDITGKDLKFSDITFGERGIGELIGRTLAGYEHSIISVTKK